MRKKELEEEARIMKNVSRVRGLGLVVGSFGSVCGAPQSRHAVHGAADVYAARMECVASGVPLQSACFPDLLMPSACWPTEATIYPPADPTPCRFLGGLWVRAHQPRAATSLHPGQLASGTPCCSDTAGSGSEGAVSVKEKGAGLAS